MQKVILYIQPQLRTTTTAQDYVRVDLMEEDLITLTQIIQDVKNIEKVFTDYSRTFNLPASKTNNKIFKYWYNPDVEGFDNQIMSNARIELNHFAFKEGKIRLESVTMKHGEPSLYKVTFFGNTTTVNDLIGEDSLDDLRWLINFNHNPTDTNVKDGLENGLNFTIDSVSYPDAIIYPLIAHSQQYIYDSTNNTSNGLNISTNSSHHLQRGVITEDLKPAILIKHIIKAIEQQYSLTFKSGEFFDSTHVSNLYMWLHRDKGKLTTENFKLLDSQSFTCVSTTLECQHYGGATANCEFDTSTGLFNFHDTNSFLTGNGQEGFNFNVEITPTISTTVYTIEVVNTLDNVVYATLENVTGTQTLNSSFGFDRNIPIAFNEKFSLAARVKSNSSLQFTCTINLQHSFVNLGTRTTIAAEMQSLGGNISLDIGVLNISENIPKMKVLDFLTGVFKMFNLTAYIDFNGEVVVKRLDDYFSGGETHNLTEYIKTDTHSIAKTIPYSEIDLEYVEAKSILAQRFFNTNNRKYGEIEYKTDATDNKIYKVTVPFEHMLFSRLSDLTTNIFTDVQTGCFLDEELNPSIGQPLLFYGVQRTGITTGINYVFGTSRPDTYAALCPTGSSNSTLTSYYMPHHANELGSVSTAPTYNLNFGSEIDTYNLTDYAGQNNSLFLKNYQEYITRVYNKKTRLYRYSAILPLKILLQLTLDDKVIVGTRIFTINSMTTKLQSGETEFELLNEAPE